MNFSERQSDPRRHIVGISVVVLVHALVVYALVTGLAKKVVDVVRAPIETKVIEEIKKPPPPQIVMPPPPKLEAPPPPYIPPPEVQISIPAPQPTISAAPSPVPPPVTVMVPTPPPVTSPAPAPAPPPRQPVVSIGVACEKQVQPVMPAKAIQDGVTGFVKALATIKGGKVIAVEIVTSQPRGYFDAAVRRAMLQYGCAASGYDEIKVPQEFSFSLE